MRIDHIKIKDGKEKHQTVIELNRLDLAELYSRDYIEIKIYESEEYEISYIVKLSDRK